MERTALCLRARALLEVLTSKINEKNTLLERDITLALLLGDMIVYIDNPKKSLKKTQKTKKHTHQPPTAND